MRVSETSSPLAFMPPEEGGRAFSSAQQGIAETVDTLSSNECCAPLNGLIIGFFNWILAPFISIKNWCVSYFFNADASDEPVSPSLIEQEANALNLEQESIIAAPSQMLSILMDPVELEKLKSALKQDKRPDPSLYQKLLEFAAVLFECKEPSSKQEALIIYQDLPQRIKEVLEDAFQESSTRVKLKDEEHFEQCLAQDPACATTITLNVLRAQHSYHYSFYLGCKSSIEALICFKEMIEHCNKSSKLALAEKSMEDFCKNVLFHFQQLLPTAFKEQIDHQMDEGFAVQLRAHTTSSDCVDAFLKGCLKIIKDMIINEIQK